MSAAVTGENQTRTGLLAGWLFLLAAAQLAAAAGLCWFFVRTEHGQRLDTIALAGNSIGQDSVDGPANTVLNALSVASIAVAVVVIGVIALARGRVLLTVVTVLFVAGANLTTQLLKQGLDRPDFGVDPQRVTAGNSFPSGHATVAATVAVALVMVLPPRVRGLAAVLGAGYAAAAGVATLSEGWHRPSDALGALLLVGAWAAGAGLVLALARGGDDVVQARDARRFAVALLALAGVALLAGAAGAFWLTDGVVWTPVEELSRRRLFIAYAGSAAGIAGTASLVMALVLATMHRVVPGRT